MRTTTIWPLQAAAPIVAYPLGKPHGQTPAEAHDAGGGGESSTPQIIASPPTLAVGATPEAGGAEARAAAAEAAEAGARRAADAKAEGEARAEADALAAEAAAEARASLYPTPPAQAAAVAAGVAPVAGGVVPYESSQPGAGFVAVGKPLHPWHH